MAQTMRLIAATCPFIESLSRCHALILLPVAKLLPPVSKNCHRDGGISRKAIIVDCSAGAKPSAWADGAGSTQFGKSNPITPIDRCGSIGAEALGGGRPRR